MQGKATYDVNAGNEAFAQAWSQHRSILLDIAYRLLSSYSEAEDIVQEAFAKLFRADLDQIEDQRAWLVVVVSRLCYDHLRSARKRRESYVGAWFPEPIVASDRAADDPADRVTLDESVRMAFLVVLERLSPAERVAWVLHDLFEIPFDQVAKIVDRSPAACRQLASRARRRINDNGGSARFEVDRDEQERIVDAFIKSCSTGDIKALLRLLDPSVTGMADVGGVPPGAAQRTVGTQAVAERLLSGIGPNSKTRLIARDVNGERGVIVVRDDSVFAVLTLVVQQGRITRLLIQMDRAKLARVPARDWLGTRAVNEGNDVVEHIVLFMLKPGLMGLKIPSDNLAPVICRYCVIASKPLRSMNWLR